MDRPNDIPADIWHSSCDNVNEWLLARDLMGIDYAIAVEGVARAMMTERERCARIAEDYDGKPCGPAELWTHEQRQFYDAGQIDASSSTASAIRNGSSPTRHEIRDLGEFVAERKGME